jgi:hypothetical protein
MPDPAFETLIFHRNVWGILTRCNILAARWLGATLVLWQRENVTLMAR